MNRRNWMQMLAGLARAMAAPGGILAQGSPKSPIPPSPAGGAIAGTEVAGVGASSLPGAAPPDPLSPPAPHPPGSAPPPVLPGLDAWLRLPLGPLRSLDDLAEASESERTVAAKLFPHLDAGRAISFRYDGGADPGALRFVLPTLLFRKIGFVEGRGSHPPVYLLAWCQLRGAPRTFRLDRMHLHEDFVLFFTPPKCIAGWGGTLYLE